jgi:pyruvate dehydrogenase E2 component (dihydrolipoamide acetyltransferase)
VNPVRELKVPLVSISMTEVRVLRWLVEDGGLVASGQPVVEIETDKATVEVEAPVAGVLRIAAAADEIVDPDRPLAHILAPGESAPAGARAEASAGKPRLRPRADLPSGSGSGIACRASPAARRLAQAHGIALDGLRGSGPEGRIVAADVEAAIRGGDDPGRER